MNIKKITWPFIFAAILLIALSSGFLLKKGEKNAENQMKAIAQQDEKLAAQDEKISEQNSKIAEQDKNLIKQNKRLTELESITKKVSQIQTDPNMLKVNLKDSDMSLIQQIIEKQVKLNMTKASLPKIGVVSIDKIFRACTKIESYRQESIAERQRADAELVKLDNEIKAQGAGLRTLKIGSENYMTQVKEMLEKQVRLKALQEFNKQQRGLKEKIITEAIYEDILRITSEIAKQKGLDLVFERSEPELPAPSHAELDLSMAIHKLLYSSGCIDITDDVMTRLNSKE